MNKAVLEDELSTTKKKLHDASTSYELAWEFIKSKGLVEEFIDFLKRDFIKKNNPSEQP